jgi:hypothetical protein
MNRDLVASFLTRRWRLLLLLLSVVVLSVDKGALSAAVSTLGQHGVLLLWLILLLEGAFNLGLLLISIGLGHSIWALRVEHGWSPRAWAQFLLPQWKTSRVARIGFFVNWLGAAMLTGALPLLVLPFLLPLRTAFPLMTVCTLDL